MKELRSETVRRSRKVQKSLTTVRDDRKSLSSLCSPLPTTISFLFHNSSPLKHHLSNHGLSSRVQFGSRITGKARADIPRYVDRAHVHHLTPHNVPGPNSFSPGPTTLNITWAECTRPGRESRYQRKRAERATDFVLSSRNWSVRTRS